MKPIRVLFAIPAKGGLRSYWLSFNTQLVAESLMGKFAPYQIDVRVEDANHILSISRDVIAEAAISEGYDILVMCDADHPITTDHLRRLLSHKAEVVGALYPGKRPGKIKFFSIITPGAKVGDDGLVECDFMGTGLIKIEVSALRRVANDNPEREYQYDRDGGGVGRAFEFFPVGVAGPRSPRAKLNRIRKLIVESGAADAAKILAIINGTDADHAPGRKLGEDYFFCFLSRSSGIKLYADTQLVIPHEGLKTFPIVPEDVSIKSELYSNSLDFSQC